MFVFLVLYACSILKNQVSSEARTWQAQCGPSGFCLVLWFCWLISLRLDSLQSVWLRETQIGSHPPARIPVAKWNLYTDHLPKMVRNPGDDWHPGWGVNPTHMDDGIMGGQYVVILSDSIWLLHKIRESQRIKSRSSLGEQNYLILLTARLFLTWLRLFQAFQGTWSHFWGIPFRNPPGFHANPSLSPPCLSGAETTRTVE